tara:strand:+ start:3772 stop:4293 length:522 start_codon:yes stop_codon:yes gene_type:complete
MMKKILMAGVMLLALTALLARAQMPFGSVAEQEYGRTLWNALQSANLVGENHIMAWPYEGNAPHGDKLVTLESEITLNGQRGTVLVKHNYGPDVTLEQVSNDPGAYLVATTVMFKREGYSAANQDWFFAKYLADATYDVAPDGATPLVGSPTGCVTCHSNAPGEDMVFLNNKY